MADSPHRSFLHLLRANALLVGARFSFHTNRHAIAAADARLGRCFGATVHPYERRRILKAAWNYRALMHQDKQTDPALWQVNLTGQTPNAPCHLAICQCLWHEAFIRWHQHTGSSATGITRVGALLPPAEDALAALTDEVKGAAEGGAAILPVGGMRVGLASFRFHLHPVIPAEEVLADPGAVARQLATMADDLLRENPAQYDWFAQR